MKNGQKDLIVQTELLIDTLKELSRQNHTLSAPLFSSVRSGDTILVGEKELCKVLSFTGGSRDPDAPSLFQVANVDTGEIKHVHAAEVKEIVSTYEEEVQQRQQQQ